MDIQTKDGILLRNIPDGTPDDAIKARIAQIRAEKAADPSEGGLPFRPFGVDTRMTMPQGVSRFAAGAGKAFTDIGRGAAQIMGSDNQAEIDESRRLDRPLMNTGAGFTGNMVGNLLPAMATAGIPGVNTMTGAALTGAVLGGAQPVATGESRLENAALGAGGGAAGQGVAKVLSRALRPVQSQLAEPLASLADKAQQQYKIPLNAAQRTGSRPLKIIDSVLDNMPLTADRQAAAKQAQRLAFNRAALSSIGENADQATPEVLNAARTRIGQQFGDLSSRNSVTLGDQFLDALAKVDSGRTTFSSPKIPELVDKGMELAAKGKISGTEYQKVRTVLGKASRDAFNSGNSEVGQALKTIRNALDDAATGSVSAADKEAWQLARQQWQALKVIEKAAAPTSADAVAGNVSAAKLAQALQSVDKQGFTYGTRGGDLPDLARIGQAFIKEQIPNSGTAQRTLYQQLLENPLSAAWQTGVGGISLPVQALLNSRAGQAYFGQGPRAVSQSVLANALRAAPGAGGIGLALSDAQQ